MIITFLRFQQEQRCERCGERCHVVYANFRRFPSGKMKLWQFCGVCGESGIRRPVS